MMKNHEDGYVLVLGIIILGALIILVFSMTNIIGFDLSFYRNNRDESRAFYAAEAGLAYGTATFWKNDYYIDDGNYNILDIDSDSVTSSAIKSDIELNTGSIEEVKWKYSDSNEIEIISTGKNNEKENSVIATYQITAFPYGVSADQINFGRNINVDGDIAASERETGDEPAVNDENVDEDAKIYAEGNFTLDGNGDVKSSEYDDYIQNEIEETYFSYFYGYKDYGPSEEPPGSFNPSDPDENKNDYDLSTESGSGNKDPEITDYITNTDQLFNQTNYIYGDSSIGTGGQVTIDGGGTLVIIGDLTIGNNIDINTSKEEYFTIIVDGNISVDNPSNAVNMSGFLYASGDIDVGNSLFINGIAYSGGEFSSGNGNLNSVEVQYDVKAASSVFGTGYDGELFINKTLSWREE